jgi:hypothetical protein
MKPVRRESLGPTAAIYLNRLAGMEVHIEGDIQRDIAVIFNIKIHKAYTKKFRRLVRRNDGGICGGMIDFL